MSEHAFSAAERAGVYRAIAERRDMRHFVAGEIEPALLGRLLEAAHMAPSVGLMQPWRFIRITRSDLREAIAEQGRAKLPKCSEFMQLKVEGIRECAELLVVALMNGREGHVFGRRTMPEMDLASAACAIQNLWLAARAEGLGMGWVSLFDPQALAALLEMPEGAQPVAVVCLGPVAEFYPAPMLALTGWTQPRPLHELLFHNGWGAGE